MGFHCWDGGHSEFTQVVEDHCYPHAEMESFFDHNFFSSKYVIRAKQDEFIEPEIGAEDLEVNEIRFDVEFEEEYITGGEKEEEESGMVVARKGAVYTDESD